MSLQISNNKVCSCRGLLPSHYTEEERLHAFSMQLTQKTPPPPCPSYKTSLAPLLNASAMTSCQTLLILLAPKIISPSPKSSPSPQMLGVNRVFIWLVLLQIGCALLASTNSPSHRNWQHPLVVWEMHLKRLGGWVLLHLKGFHCLLHWVVTGPSDKPDKLPKASFVHVPLMRWC